MSSGINIYNYPRRLELALRHLANDKKLRPADRAKILKFKDECVAQGLSTPRIIRYIQMLSKLSALLGKRFESATRDDIVCVVGKVENNSYKDWTKQSYKIALKKFYVAQRHRRLPTRGQMAESNQETEREASP